MATPQAPHSQPHSHHHQHLVSLEEPRSLVQQLVTKFYPENDMAMIINIDQAHTKVMQNRQKELTTSHEQLQLWIKKVEAAKWEAQRPADRSELKHAERMSEAEREKFQLIKAINDQELAVQQLESAVAAGKAQLTRLREQIVRLEQPDIDIYSLQLQLLSSLKATWSGEAQETQCMVKSRAKNDIHVFRLSDHADKMDLTQRIWEAISNAP